MKNKKTGFTLAEALITLVIIGVVATMMLSTLFSVTPDEGKFKAKKAFNTFTRAVQNLINGPYDLTGNLEASVTYNGSYIDNTAMRQQFCYNLSETLNLSGKANCSNNYVSNSFYQGNKAYNGVSCGFSNGSTMNYICDITYSMSYGSSSEFMNAQNDFDSVCNYYFNNYTKNDPKKYNFKTSDGIYWGIQLTDFSNRSTVYYNGVNIPVFYNVICMQTDNNESVNNMYSLGVRRDGKVIPGVKLQKVLNERDVKNEN